MTLLLPVDEYTQSLYRSNEWQVPELVSGSVGTWFYIILIM